MSHLPAILLVDDGADDRELISLLLRGAFGEVQIEAATDASSLARAMSAGRFGAVVTEHELSWIRSGDLLRLIHDLRPDCPVLVVTNRPIERVAAEIVHLAPDALLPKSASGLIGLPRALRAALLSARRRAAAEGADPASRRMLDALPAGILAVSSAGTIEDANPELARILGFASAADCVQRPFAAIFAVAADCDALLARVGEREGVASAKLHLRRDDGTAVAAELALWRAAGSPGTIQGMVRRLPPDDIERPGTGEVGESAAARERSHSELDEMAYAVSHDLRQPLTQVVRFLELLAAETGGRGGKEGARLLDQARASASRLEQMLEAVLRLARIEGREVRSARVDLDALAARVIARLEPETAAAGGRIERAALPVVEGDEAQLELVLQNLLDNALKFRGTRAPRIRIDGLDEPGLWHIRVADNGIGVPAQDSERIFALFQRLHTAGEVAGNGIGLALCRRVVARHGGRIWVETNGSEGSTFHFTLARRTAASFDNERGAHP
jgi:signal transduction histidine kinase